MPLKSEMTDKIKTGRKPVAPELQLKPHTVYLNDADWKESQEAGASDVHRIGLALVRKRKSRSEKAKDV